MNDIVADAGFHQKSKKHHKKSKGDDDDTIAEKEAREGEIQEAKKQGAEEEKKRAKEARLRDLNDWDGTYHNKDGSRSFHPEDTPVAGVNNYHEHRHKKHSKKHHRHHSRAQTKDDEVAEVDEDGAKNAELNGFKKEGEKISAGKKVEENRKTVNEYDGLNHNADGSRNFWPEGNDVGGVNNYH
jgi:hypothetical protein